MAAAYILLRFWLFGVPHVSPPKCGFLGLGVGWYGVKEGGWVGYRDRRRCSFGRGPFGP